MENKELQIPQNLSKIIDVLAEKFGSTGKELWASVIKQMGIDGHWNAFVAALMFVGQIVILVPWWLVLHESSFYDQWGLYLLFWGVFITVNLMILASVKDAIDKILNPTYSAVESILSMVKEPSQS